MMGKQLGKQNLDSFSLQADIFHSYSGTFPERKFLNIIIRIIRR